MGLLIVGVIIVALILYANLRHKHIYKEGNGKCLTCGKLHRDYCPAPNCYPTQKHDWQLTGQDDPHHHPSMKYYGCQNCGATYEKRQY